MERYESYKPSGMSWIGEIPSHWDILYLSQVAKEHNLSNKEVHHQNLLSLSYGKIIRKDINKTEGLLPSSFDTYQIVEPGNIVMRLTDLQNDHKSLRVGLVNEEGIITSAYVAMEVSKTINPDFFYLMLHSFDIKKVFYSMGGGLRQNLNYDGLRKLSIPIPPLDEQKKIVEFLSTKTSQIDAQQRERERELRLLDELKQSEIANVVTRGLNPDVPMKDSGIPWIGQIPAHWDIQRLGSLFHDRISLNADYKFNRAYKFNYGTLVPKEETGDVADLKDTYIKYSVLQQNDIVINGLNLNYDFVSKRVAISPTDCIITSAYLVLRPYNNTYSEYFLQLFKAMDSQKLFHGMGTGIRLTLSFNELKSQYLPIPPIEEQKAIVDYIQQKNSAIDEMIANLRAEIDFLIEYKQRLIADVVTGQIKVD